MKPVAEALKVGGQSCFGGAIEIVALSAPVPCHGGQGADEPAALFLKVVGNNIQCRDTSGEVGIQDAPCLAKVRLCGILVAEISDEKTSPCKSLPVTGEAAGENCLVVFKVKGVEGIASGLHVVADLEVGCLRLHFLAVPPRQDQIIPMRGELASHCPGNRR